MALADLLEILAREADERAAALVAGARADAERLVAEARARLDHRLAEAVAAREAELRTAAQGEIEAARRAAARDVLGARAEALARIFARVRALLAERAGDPALEPRWARDVSEALTYLPGGDAVVRRPPEVAGVIVVAADGSVEVNGTIDGLLARLEPSLAIELARELEAAP